MTKKEQFAKAFKDFQECEIPGYSYPDVKDWMDLFMKFNLSTRQGSGLTWSEIQEIIEKELK